MRPTAFLKYSVLWNLALNQVKRRRLEVRWREGAAAEADGQAAEAADHAVQARFKVGVCLMQLGRLDDARDWLKDLYEQGLKTW